MAAAVAQRLSSPSRVWVTAVVAAGLAGAAVDGLYASCVGIIRFGSVPRVWRGVASGWLGKAAAAKSGLAAVGLGLATHIGIALCMAAVFAAAAARREGLLRRPFAFGALYGLILYVVMYQVVLPLRWPAVFPRWDGVWSLADIAVHLGVGLAIALTLAAGLRGRFRLEH